MNVFRRAGGASWLGAPTAPTV
eukprot:SAG11_NODE_25278_length_361_cov_0.595420_1_plen_21_part_10